MELAKDKVEKNRLCFDCPGDPPFLTITEVTVQAEQTSSHRTRGCTTIIPSLNEAIDLNGIVWRLCCCFVYFLLTHFFLVECLAFSPSPLRLLFFYAIAKLFLHQEIRKAVINIEA